VDAKYGEPHRRSRVSERNLSCVPQSGEIAAILISLFSPVTAERFHILGHQVLGFIFSNFCVTDTDRTNKLWSICLVTIFASLLVPWSQSPILFYYFKPPGSPKRHHRSTTARYIQKHSS